MDARTFLEAKRRQFIKFMAISLLIISVCCLIIIAVLFALTENSALAVAMVILVCTSICYSVTWALIARAPLWQAMLPVCIAFLLAALAMGLLLPELKLIAIALLLVLLILCTLSNSRYLTLSIALVSGLIGITLVMLSLPVSLTFSLGNLQIAITVLITVSIISCGTLVVDRFIASQNAALALAESSRAEAETARAEAETAYREVARLHISEQQLNLQLAESNRTLEQQVAARTDDLQSALTSMQGANVRLEGLLSFVRFMQHEIRGYAAGLEGLTPLLRQGFETHPQAMHYLVRLAGLEETVTQMNELTQRVLILTREGTLPLAQQQAVALLPLLEQVRQKTLDFAQHLDFALDVRLEVAPDLMVLGDALYLALACYTGLRNAVEVLSAQDREDAAVTVAARAEAQQVQLELRDNGPGFPTALLDAVALARQNAGGFVIGWSSKRGGSGLGLALMERVAQLHGGSLAIGNRSDQPGAWITLSLPRAELATGV